MKKQNSELKIDFEKDLKLEIKRVSSEMGIKISFKNDLHQILLDYLTVRLKIIDIKMRKIKFNPDFFIQLNKHPKRKEIQKISQLASVGENLNIFQSRKLLQSRFHDHLSSEWNIYHFHLSLKIEKSGFVKQGNQLLFAYIDDNQVIFLGTDTHKDGIFGDTKWIEILHDHFPKVIEKYKDDTILNIHPKVNSVERQMLWNKGLSLGMTKIRDTIYHNPGIGRMTSGHSMDVSRTAMDVLRWIRKLKLQLEESSKEICEFIKVPISQAKFNIRFSEKLELYEKSKGIKLLNFPDILIEKEEIIKRQNTGYNNGYT